jgi:hypothetical protein
MEKVTIAPKNADTSEKNATTGKPEYIFGKQNMRLMLIGVLVICIGFFLMSGGKSPDPHKFNYDEIYSFRRITLAPIVVLLGFVIEGFAIMWRPKN